MADTDEVNIVSLKLLQASLHAKSQRLGMVASEVTLQSFLVHLVANVIRCVLGGQDDLVSYFALLHPLADPGFTLLVLVVVCRVDEVASALVDYSEVSIDIRLMLTRQATGTFPKTSTVRLGRTYSNPS